MPLTAHTVLEDCRQAAAQLTPGIQGSQWRIAYMANVALLRTVYHVLESRDAATDPALRQAFKVWAASILASKPRPEIYWEFIFGERNMLLKEYRSSAGQGVTVPGLRIEVDLKTGEQNFSRLGVTEHHYTMNGGFFAGRDHRELITEAIAWWETQLATLEASAGAA